MPWWWCPCTLLLWLRSCNALLAVAPAPLLPAALDCMVSINDARSSESEEDVPLTGLTCEALPVLWVALLPFKLLIRLAKLVCSWLDEFDVEELPWDLWCCRACSAEFCVLAMLAGADMDASNGKDGISRVEESRLHYQRRCWKQNGE